MIKSLFTKGSRRNWSVRALVVGLTFASHGAGADCLQSIPKDSTFDFARVILAGVANPGPRERRALDEGCSSLNLTANPTLARARSRKAIEGDRYGMTDALVQIISHMTAVNARLGDTPIERAYLAEIDRIKTLKDPILRMRAAYDLAQRFQGKTMDPTERRRDTDFASPRGTLTRADQTGFGGVCRDFSSLLVFTLERVAKDANGHPQFSAEFLPAVNHAVVKVKIPPKTDSRWDWGQEFALDPTNMTEFSPIPPPDLLSPDSKLAADRDRCDKIMTCVIDQVVAERRSKPEPPRMKSAEAFR